MILSTRSNSWGDVASLRGRNRKRTKRSKKELGSITGGAVRPRLDRPGRNSIPKNGQLRARELEVGRIAHAASAGLKRGGRIGGQQ
jgi:hypothetical protein